MNREWWAADTYYLPRFQDRCFAYEFIVVVLISFLRFDQSLFNLFSLEGILARRRLRNMLGDMFLDKYIQIADE